MSEQISTWNSKFGIDYANRNLYPTSELDIRNVNSYGITCAALNQSFFKRIHSSRF